MKNLIYAGSSTNSSVVSGAIIPLTSIEKKYNRCNSCNEVDLVGNVITIETANKRPRYNIWAKITFTGVTAGLAEISIYKNGVLIPFAVGSETITTAGTEVHTITIPASILTDCCSTTSISIVNSGAIGLTVTNVNILVIED